MIASRSRCVQESASAAPGKLHCPKFVYELQTLRFARHPKRVLVSNSGHSSSGLYVQNLDVSPITRFPSVHTARRFLCLSMAAMTSPDKGRCVSS